MGRLTEAFGFLKVDPSEFTPLWRKHHITTLEPSVELYSLRIKALRANTKAKKEAENDKNA